MPDGDRVRPIQIGVDLIAAIAAVEIRGVRTDTQMQATGTSLRSVARLDIAPFHAGSRSLVRAHLLKLGEAPIRDVFRLPVLPNPVEVFQDDPSVVRPGLGHDLFADAVVGIRDESPFTARDTLERAFSALTAVSLKRSSRPFVAGFLVANLLRRVKLLVRRDRDAVDAEVDAETAGRFGDFRRRNRDRKMQGEASRTINQFGGTRLARA